MIDVDYGLLDKIKLLIINGNNFKNISNILNLDIHYVIYLSKKIKSNIIASCNNEEFYIVKIIDKLLHKQYKSTTSFSYDLQYKILDMIHLSDEEIMSALNINKYRYVSFLRSMYFMLSVYNMDVDKSYLGLIKKKLDNIILSYKRNVNHCEINENNLPCDVLFDDNIFSCNVSFGKIAHLSDEENVKFIVISDTHFGARYENMSYIDYVYNYAKKNGIKYIIVTGDLIEGNCFNYYWCKKEYSNIKAQLEHVFYDYCYDDEIKNIILLGNHDFSSFVKEGVDISKYLSIRDDFEILGYKEAYLKVRDDIITLKHEVSKILNALNNPSTSLNFMGHSHQYRCLYNNDSVIYRVPALCDVSGGFNYTVNKGFLVCELNFDSVGLCNIESEYINFDGDNISFVRKFI